MKKGVIIFLILLGMSSCLEEDMDGCPSKAYLVFALADQYSTGDFDSEVGNDVHLHFFKEGYFQNEIVIPYGLISHGKPYLLEDIQEQMQVLAYSIPAGDPGSINSPAPGEDYYGQLLRMEQLRASEVYKAREGSLYLGRIVVDYNPPDNTYVINMSPCFAKVSVIIMDAERFSADYPGTPSAQIEGTGGVFRIHDSHTSVPVEIVSELIPDTGTYTTGVLYLLPQPDSGGTINIRIYNDSNLAMYVETDEKSVAGKEITVRIYPHILTAEITVDGWTYKTQVATP